MADKEEPADDAGKEEPADDKPADEEKKDEEEDSSPSDLVDKANEAAERLETATKELNKSLARQEKLAVETTLGGTTNAGQPANKETDEEYADKVAKGEANPLEDDGFKTQ